MVKFKETKKQLLFKECSICRVKPGSPTLCDSCVHNRSVIESISEEDYPMTVTTGPTHTYTLPEHLTEDQIEQIGKIISEAYRNGCEDTRKAKRLI